ncbi:MAG: hypothetical protein JXB88_20480 [Spirochaetales bacterium]|nr:hypothetical protein [Spirochaetales bacterium]
MKYELKALSFGETLDRAFNMYIDNFITLFLICMVIRIPFIFFTGNMTNQAIDAQFSENYVPLIVSSMLMVIVSFVLSAIETGLIVNFIAHKYLGKEINTGDFFNKIKSSLLPLIGLSLLVGLCVILGTIALVIPGIIISFGLILSTQVLVIEKKGIIESMKRSWALTKGKKFKIFLMLLIVGIIIGILNQLSNYIMEILIKSIGLGGVWIGAFISFFFSAVTSPFQSCIIVLIYFNSRIENEGFALEHLADQFLPEEEKFI